jgi:hypothetical protein
LFAASAAHAAQEGEILVDHDFAVGEIGTRSPRPRDQLAQHEIVGDPIDHHHDLRHPVR